MKMGGGLFLKFGVALIPTHPHPSTIRLSRVGDSFLENVCGHTVTLQIPWSAKYENENFEKAFPFYRA